MSKESEFWEMLKITADDTGDKEDTTVWDKENTWNGYPLYKESEESQVWWVDNFSIGEIVFTLDKKKFYHLYRDYSKMSKEEKEIFDKSEPFWAEFFNK